MALGDIAGSTFGPLGNTGPNVLTAPSTFNVAFSDPAFFANGSNDSHGFLRGPGPSGPTVLLVGLGVITAWLLTRS